MNISQIPGPNVIPNPLKVNASYAHGFTCNKFRNAYTQRGVGSDGGYRHHNVTHISVV